VVDAAVLSGDDNGLLGSEGVHLLKVT
jgi:hypothetical protein